jgi:hypothetical protein
MLCGAALLRRQRDVARRRGEDRIGDSRVLLFGWPDVRLAADPQRVEPASSSVERSRSAARYKMG